MITSWLLPGYYMVTVCLFLFIVWLLPRYSLVNTWFLFGYFLLNTW